MKFFWWYVFGLISVLLLSSIFLEAVTEDFAVDGTEGSNKDSALKTTTLSNNSFVEYHMSEDILRKSTQHKMKSMNVINQNGDLVAMDFEPTQVFPVYYTPGSYLYGAAAYVPTYEDSVKLSEVKSKMKRKIKPLKWSWSKRSNQREIYNTIIKAKDLKPIIKEDIPSNGILPTGYFVLHKSKTYNKFQMGLIPNGYFIYDDSNMAPIPPGFQASVDKMYIFRKK